MIKALYYAQAALAVWVVASPFALGYSSGVSTSAAVALGSVVLVVALVGAARQAPALGTAVAVLGVVAVLCGIVELVVGSLSGGVGEVVVGLCWALLGTVVALIRTGLKLSAFDVHGNTLADIDAMSMKKNGDLAAKAVLLNSMPSTMYFRPEEVWKALGLLSWDTVRRLPAFLVTGALRVRGAARAQDATTPRR